ncbi:class I SAM-dependent methyltransferase [Sphingomonas naphthae]|uniref:Class I SAM-dependent methyltransferase n=1 Tax=Sphingomonas naphthae TaxID=1813468 RepID=A0ABY7TMV2_9SPHN|nr:class I SAM-dependent methyltransferase [Sphingomonas naphthae]WCT73559.1 class I SAM-dependent methyltransferase [Sphingomonas naphthae]
MILFGQGSAIAPQIVRLLPQLRAAWDMLVVIVFGGIGWPWLLRSLGGGSPAARATLLARTGLPDDALPAKLGSWRADANFLTLIADEILTRRPRTIVEFGGGTTTLVAARCLANVGEGGSFVSVDGDTGFAADTRAMLARQGLGADIRAVPLADPPDGWPGQWYDHGPLPAQIDMMIVDGPPWAIHPMVRGAAASLFGRIAPGGVVLLDDAARPGERLVARRWRREWPDFDWRRIDGPAGTLIGVRRADPHG